MLRSPRACISKDERSRCHPIVLSARAVHNAHATRMKKQIPVLCGNLRLRCRVPRRSRQHELFPNKHTYRALRCAAKGIGFVVRALRGDCGLGLVWSDRLLEVIEIGIRACTDRLFLVVAERSRKDREWAWSTVWSLRSMIGLSYNFWKPLPSSRGHKHARQTRC